MANKSLTATPLSHNDVKSLAKLLKSKFQYYFTHQDSFDKYPRHLVVLVGLGFTAIMEDSAYTLLYKKRFNDFLDYFSKLSPNISLSPVSLAAAEIVSKAANLFPRLHYPHYYEAFKITLKKVIGSGFEASPKKAEESNRLMQLMIKKENDI